MVMCFHLNSLEELHTFMVRVVSVVTTNAGVSADEIGFSFLFSRKWLKKRFCFTSGPEYLIEAFDMY